MATLAMGPQTSIASGAVGAASVAAVHRCPRVVDGRPRTSRRVVSVPKVCQQLPGQASQRAINPTNRYLARDPPPAGATTTPQQEASRTTGATVWGVLGFVVVIIIIKVNPRPIVKVGPQRPRHACAGSSLLGRKRGKGNRTSHSGSAPSRQQLTLRVGGHVGVGPSAIARCAVAGIVVGAAVAPANRRSKQHLGRARKRHRPPVCKMQVIKLNCLASYRRAACMCFW